MDQQTQAALGISVPRDHATPSVPPALPRRLPIRLPALSPNIPIQTHPLITYRYSTAEFSTLLLWNISLPPSAARLAPALSVHESSGWLHQPALKPRSIDSMVIRVPGINRPIVVFPVHTGSPITIGDILRAISDVLRAATTTEYSPDSSNFAGVDIRNPAVIEAMATQAIRMHFHRRVYWGGLIESPAEQDVWVLQLHYANRGGRRSRMVA